jgi:hypothetical protein
MKTLVLLTAIFLLSSPVFAEELYTCASIPSYNNEPSIDKIIIQNNQAVIVDSKGKEQKDFVVLKSNAAGVIAARAISNTDDMPKNQNRVIMEYFMIDKVSGEYKRVFDSMLLSKIGNGPTIYTGTCTY